MNAPSMLLTLLAALPLASVAALPTTPALRVDCARPVLPAQREVAELVGIANIGQAYAARTRLMQDVQRACKRGVSQVQLVREPRKAGAEPAVAVVDAAQP